MILSQVSYEDTLLKTFEFSVKGLLNPPLAKRVYLYYREIEDNKFLLLSLNDGDKTSYQLINISQGEEVWSHSGYWLDQILSSHLAVLKEFNDQNEILGCYLLSFRTGDVEYFPYDQTDPNLVQLASLNEEVIVLADTEYKHYLGYGVSYE